MARAKIPAASCRLHPVAIPLPRWSKTQIRGPALLMCASTNQVVNTKGVFHRVLRCRV